MKYLCIQLHPERLSNPDLDIRYDLPSALAALSNDEFTVEDEGYDYSDEEQYLNIFLRVDNLRVKWFKINVIPSRNCHDIILEVVRHLSSTLSTSKSMD